MPISGQLLKIREALDKIKSKWIVSYDNCPEIKEIYKGYHQEDYELNYSAYYKTKGSEVMIYCDSIKAVNVQNKQINLEIA